MGLRYIPVIKCMNIKRIIKEEINDISWIQDFKAKWDTTNIHLVAGKKFYVDGFPPPTYTTYWFEDVIKPKPSKKRKTPMPEINICWQEKSGQIKCNNSARWRIIELLNKGTWILIDDEEPIMESNDFDWIKDSKESLKDKVILFEPMIDKGEWEKVLDSLMNHVVTFDEDITWWSGLDLDVRVPFHDTNESLLHHLLISNDGRMVSGGIDTNLYKTLIGDGYTDYDIRCSYDEYYTDIDLFIEAEPNKFDDPDTIDGREYFNIPYKNEID